MKRVLLSWSSGKDSAWTLHALQNDPSIAVVGLLTTFNESADRVAMHAVRHILVEAQARAAGVAARCPVQLPWSCPNELYEVRMREAVDQARKEEVTHIAFGDLFLEDIRAYRELNLAGTGINPLFPIWTTSEGTRAVARDVDAGRGPASRDHLRRPETARWAICRTAVRRGLAGRPSATRRSVRGAGRIPHVLLGKARSFR